MEKAATGFMPNVDAARQLEEAPDLPEEAAQVWATFLEIQGRCEFDQMGRVRLTWASIQAWQGVTHSTLEAWELTALFAIDDAYFNANNSKDS